MTDFQTLIRAHQEKHKSTLAEAMQAVARTNPESHRNYLQAGGPLNKVSVDDGKDFLTLADEYRERNGCTKVASLQAVARLYPNKHRQFIESSNQRKDS
jgi:hypothetical protein